MSSDESEQEEVERGAVAVVSGDLPAASNGLAVPDHSSRVRRAGTRPARPVPDLPVAPLSDIDALDALDHPRLVLSESFVGIDRRRVGVRAGLSRSTFGQRRRLLRLDALTGLAVAVLVVGAVLLVATRPASGPTSHPANAGSLLPTDLLGVRPEIAVPSSAAAPKVPAATATAPAAPPVTAPSVAAPPVTAPPATAAPVAAPPATVPPSTPEAMGAAALALVRYPWQQLPGYTIRFLPIADAPSPGFYGNTEFTWGQPGGVSTLYVYPGESVERLAGITAFEIGHEVDGGYVEPQGGHTQISAILGVDPPSWAPQCDCAEQGYLSGWYAAAFSDYWSPGVGAWSTLAPMPTGATLTAVAPWLDPRLS